MIINLILNLEIGPESFRADFCSSVLEKIFTAIKCKFNWACAEQRAGYKIQMNLQNSPGYKVKFKLFAM